MQPFTLRRQKLLSALPDNSIALIASGHEQIRNRDTHYPFRPHSDFQYLTGFNEPDAVLALIKTNTMTCHLCLRPKDKEREIWDGLRLGIEAAPDALEMDSAHDINDLQNLLSEWLANKAYVFISFDESTTWIPRLLPIIQQLKRRVRQGISAPHQLSDLDKLLHEQRLIKDEAAQAGLRKAAKVTVSGHLAAMRTARSGIYEYELQASLEQTYKQLGSTHQAFSTIVAGGKNACILHYTENNQLLCNADLVLIDAGAEIDGYAGDCTNTFPISGRFSNEQGIIYDLVLAAQQAALATIKPGVNYDVPHKAAVKVIAQGLWSLGLINATSLDEIINNELYKPFYMHQTGHWLGCDVHDVGEYKINGSWRPLVEGMALTVEPGIYIAPDMQQVDVKWRGIGIRIEDSVLVTETGYECLTIGLPRTRDEIESWMQNR